MSFCRAWRPRRGKRGQRRRLRGMRGCAARPRRREPGSRIAVVDKGSTLGRHLVAVVDLQLGERRHKSIPSGTRRVASARRDRRAGTFISDSRCRQESAVPPSAVGAATGRPVPGARLRDPDQSGSRARRSQPPSRPRASGEPERLPRSTSPLAASEMKGAQAVRHLCASDAAARRTSMDDHGLRRIDCGGQETVASHSGQPGPTHRRRG